MCEKQLRKRAAAHKQGNKQMTAANKIANIIAAQTEKQAIQVYAGLRIALADARRAKADHASGLMQVLKLAGDALEARIGSDRFDDLMDQIDAQIYA
jgi:hypothetical protein